MPFSRGQSGPPTGTSFCKAQGNSHGFVSAVREQSGKRLKARRGQARRATPAGGITAAVTVTDALGVTPMGPRSERSPAGRQVPGPTTENFCPRQGPAGVRPSPTSPLCVVMESGRATRGRWREPVSSDIKWWSCSAGGGRERRGGEPPRPPRCRPPCWRSRWPGAAPGHSRGARCLRWAGA